MKVVILCGGQGTRIRDVSEVLPKPMIPIGGKPMLWHIMKLYSYYGVDEFILCLGYKGWKIKEFFLFYKYMTSDFRLTLGDNNSVEYYNEPEEIHWKITFVETGELSQTGDRVNKIKKYLGDDENFCLSYGDGISNVNIKKLIKFHEKNKTIGTITGVRPLGRFGEIEMENNIAVEFNEKPNVSRGRINGGFMVFNNKKIWKYFSDKKDLIFEKDVLPLIVKDRQLSVYEHNDFWQCMDTMREYEMLNNVWDKGDAPWKIWE